MDKTVITGDEVNALSNSSEEKKMTEFIQATLNYTARYAGNGSATSKYLMTLSKLNRFGSHLMERNHEVSGLTVFTRPTLNLSEPNLKMDRIMRMLNVTDPKSMLFSMRCYLDSMSTNTTSTDPRAVDIRNKSRICPYFNYESGFILPLTNQLSSIDGFIDYNIDTETSDAGYNNEDQTIAVGADFGNKTYNLTASFYDLKGGYIFALYYYYLRYIALVSKGPLIPYPGFEHLLDYSQSIYRFVLDPSRQYIMKCAKATGCYPVSMTIGSIFNVSENQHYIASSENVTINYTANHIEYIDAAIFMDFNTLVKRYCPDIESRIKSAMAQQNNFTGLPYVDVLSGTNELMWMCLAEELDDTELRILQELRNELFGM